MPYTRYHPVYLDLNGRKVVIVGGGAIAVEKLESLMDSGAHIEVIAPDANDQIIAWSSEGRFEWRKKTFEDSDVDGAFMVIAATDDAQLNAHIYSVGNSLLRLVNSVDDPEHCNFIMAAITARGPMQVAISSAGCSPAMAQFVRNRIAQEILTEEIGEAAEYLGDWRPRLKEELPTYRHRKGFWQRVVGSAVPKALLTHGRDAADIEMESAIAWSQKHLDCLVCDCVATDFCCVKGTV